MRHIALLVVFVVGCTKPESVAVPKKRVAPPIAQVSEAPKHVELLDPSEPEPPPRKECLSFDSDSMKSETRTLEGVVNKGKNEHPTRGPFTYYYLHLDKPMCVSGDPGAESIQDLQLVPDDKGLFPPRGKRVRLTGHYFTWGTAWHVTKLLLHDYEFEVVR